MRTFEPEHDALAGTWKNVQEKLKTIIINDPKALNRILYMIDSSLTNSPVIFDENDDSQLLEFLDRFTRSMTTVHEKILTENSDLEKDRLMQFYRRTIFGEERRQIAKSYNISTDELMNNVHAIQARVRGEYTKARKKR
ncbi:hypothetical protein IT418_02265 [bacterium]|nr:hypothetical protein [bacterium]